MNLLASATLFRGAVPDLSFVPPMQRRRLSPLQRIFFHLAHEAVPLGVDCEMVFASRWGEVGRTRELVRQYAEEGEVSPQKFSASVYNAAPGLYSIFSKNRAPYTAIAAGEESLENGILLALLAKGPCAFVYAEEVDGGFGCAGLFSPDGGGEKALSVRIAPNPGTEAMGFDALAQFLSGGLAEVKGRNLWLGWA